MEFLICLGWVLIGGAAICFFQAITKDKENPSSWFIAGLLCSFIGGIMLGVGYGIKEKRISSIDPIVSINVDTYPQIDTVIKSSKNKKDTTYVLYVDKDILIKLIEN